MRIVGPRVVTGLLLLAVQTGCQSVDLTTLRLLPPAAANLPRTVRIDPDVPFVMRETTPLLLDLYRPQAAANPLGLVVVVHGGSWRSGSRTDMAEFAYDIAAQGYAAATVQYRLVSDDVTYPQPVRDVVDATRFLLDNADAFGLDRARVALLGLSAGANMALLAGMCDDLSIFDDSLPRGFSLNARCVVDLFGPTDFTVDVSAFAESQIRIATRYLGFPLTADITSPAVVAKRAEASPATYARPGGPTVLIIHGTADRTVPYSQAEALSAALEAVGQPHEFVTVEGMDHIPGAIWFSPYVQYYRPRLLGFLGNNL